MASLRWMDRWFTVSRIVLNLFRASLANSSSRLCFISPLGGALVSPRLRCHGARYLRYARGWYAYPVRTVRGALWARLPAPPVRTQRGRLVRVARTYPTEAAGRTCQLSAAPVLAALHATPRHAFDVERRAILVERRRVRRQPAIMRAELEHGCSPPRQQRGERVLRGG